MATISKVAMLLAGAHSVVLAALAAPATAYAQTAQEPAPAPLTARMPGTLPPASPVWVHIQGSDVAELQQDVAGDHKQWVTVCAAPCDKAVSPQFAYRISGEGIRNSKPFTLHSLSGDHETLTVDEGSKGGFVLGIVGLSAGGFVMVVGLFVVLIGALENAAQDAFGSELHDHNSTEEVGGVLSLVGLAGIIGGAVSLASNVHSDVTQGAVSAPAAALPSGGWASAPGFNAAFKDAFKDARHEPGWAALPPAIGVPLFGARF